MNLIKNKIKRAFFGKNNYLKDPMTYPKETETRKNRDSVKNSDKDIIRALGFIPFLFRS